MIEHDHTFVVFIADLCSLLDKVSYFKTLEEKQIERTVQRLFAYPYMEQMEHSPDISTAH